MWPQSNIARGVPVVPHVPGDTVIADLWESICEQREGHTSSRGRAIDHFTVVGLVTWFLNGSETGVDLVLIKTSLLLLCKSSCSYAN